MQLRRIALGLVLALAGITGGVALAPGPSAHAADSRAVVIVDTGSGVHRTVVTFGGTITGLQALELAGASPVTVGYSGQGAAICALYGVGHEASSSDCLGTPDDPSYWAYFKSPAASSGWTYSRGCACSSVVHDGDVEGWRFGTGQQPPYSSFCAVAGCAPPPAPPAPTAAPATAGSGSGAGSPPPSVAGTEANAPPRGGDVGGTGNGATATSTVPAGGSTLSPASTTPSTTRAAARDRSRSGSGDESAAGFGTGGNDGDGGSPWGVVGAAVLVGLLATGAWWLRRGRLRRAGPPD